MKFIAALTTATALSLGLAAPAAAVTPQEICRALATSPTEETIVRAALQGMHDGQTPEQVGENFVIAATVTCPKYYDLIVSTMTRLSEQGEQVPAKHKLEYA